MDHTETPDPAFWATLEPLLTTTWPKPGAKWPKEAIDQVGVYALVHGVYAYVGMTVSTNGFKGRWMRHHRMLFTRKQAIKSTKMFRTYIKANDLTPQDFTLYALKGWPNPKEALTKELTTEIALEEQRLYDLVAAAGFTMLNNMRPTGAGYEKAVDPRKRRRRKPKPTV